jgi:hypothetical protein
VPKDTPDDFFDRAVRSHTFKILTLSSFVFFFIDVLVSKIGESLHPGVAAVLALAIVSFSYIYMLL